MKHIKNLIPLLLLAASSVAAAETWTIDTQLEWDESIKSKSNLKFEDGMARPTAKNATLQSVLKTFSEKRFASSIQFAQSPVWLNWEPIENIGTKSMWNAPVLLSVGPGNYWMFSRHSNSSNNRMKSHNKPLPPFVGEPATLEGFDIPLLTTQHPNEFAAPGGLNEDLVGYHAWQSRDMKNWVHHGPITEDFSRWMTTAEYVDGEFYFYYDFPNDQDPHLYIDADPTDGKLGKDMGMAFKDPSHGSDCAVIRDLAGNFHIIYEDWSPINAQKHAWDSPLAGHAVSPDGIKDFKILAPAVDARTTPTGKIGKFRHPGWAREDPANYESGHAEYEIHEPDQPAYGDWAAISIGGHYYLFGDYEPAGSKEMSVAMLTTQQPGLGNEQFQFFGNIGEGHPDPDICFAEGRFYLATQQESDFTSPGPWVESVEIRVGVDTDNDAIINEWTNWEVVKESYDYTPGFAKQIQRTAASMDLSSLPAGYGFQFEVKMTDTTENDSKPILDKVALSFK